LLSRKKEKRKKGKEQLIAANKESARLKIATFQTAGKTKEKFKFNSKQYKTATKKVHSIFAYCDGFNQLQFVHSIFA
jgi:hypothetical protein